MTARELLNAPTWDLLDGCVINADCIEAMAAMPECSADAVVCDPPYDLTSARPGGRSPATEGAVMRGFMGLEWGGSGVAFRVETWVEALRILKPGGHLLAFGGTRTYHRLACAIEDAGFEIRDRILCLTDGGDAAETLGPELAWIYGSGLSASQRAATYFAMTSCPRSRRSFGSRA